MKSSSIIFAIILLLTSISGTSIAQEVFKAKRVSVNNDYAITLPDPNNKYRVRFEVRPGEYASNGSRSELMFTNLGWTSHFEFFFKPVRYRYENSWIHLADWHVSTELYNIASKRGIKLSSPLMLGLEKNKIILSNRAGVFTGNVFNLKMKESSRIRIFTTPLIYDWNHVSIDIVWSDKEDGKIIVNINGDKKVISNIRTAYDMSYANFFKLGIYRSPKHVTTTILEFKDIIVGNKLLTPDFSKKASGEQNNDPEIIRQYERQ